MKRLMLAQVIITLLAFILDLYGCFNLSFIPAVISVVFGILDILTLYFYLKKKK